MIAKHLAGIGAESSASRTLRELFRDQRDRAVQSDAEDVVAGVEAGIGLLMLHIRTEAADAGLDRLAGFGMLADFARQRQQVQRQWEFDIGRIGAFRDAGARRLFALGDILLLAELDVRTGPPRLHLYIQPSGRGR